MGLPSKCWSGVGGGVYNGSWVYCEENDPPDPYSTHLMMMEEEKIVILEVDMEDIELIICSILPLVITSGCLKKELWSLHYTEAYVFIHDYDCSLLQFSVC